MLLSRFLSARTVPGLLAAVLLPAIAGLVLFTAHARAAEAEGSNYGSVGQYGEVTRFGGFDTTWFDEGKYDGKGTPGPDESEPKPGLFLNPVGFAVDTDDEGKGTTAIYVLDRVSGYPQAGSLTTEWRLQKLSDTGALLGTTEFYLSETLVSGADVPTGVVGLAIDDTTGRVYTLVYETTGSGDGATTYAKEIVGWSTTPNAEGKLVAPGESGSYPALPEEASGPITPVSGYTAPGLLTAALASPSPALYGPLGLALDVTGDQDYLAIEADSKVNKSTGAREGPAVVEQVSTATGAESGSWSASSLTTSAFPNASTKDSKASAAGIAVDPTSGNLEVLLNASEAVNAVGLEPDLAGPTILYSSKLENEDGDANPIHTIEGVSAAPSAAAIELSNGLYATDDWENLGSGYWSGGGNEGIRLISPLAEGLWSDKAAPQTSIFDTLGNATFGGACNISAGIGDAEPNSLAFAAGANGTVWVLTTGADSSGYSGSGSDAAYISGRQVIEFSPKQGTPCVGPPSNTTFSYNAEGGSPQKASESSPLTVPVGTTVEFDASTIEYPRSEPSNPDTQAPIFAYEWDPIGASTGGANNDGYTTISTATKGLPTATASYQYKTIGEYTAKLKLLGTFGEYDASGTVDVQTVEPPTAVFTAPSEVQVGQKASFDASESKEASGAEIVAYEWKFGDGQNDTTNEPFDEHEYAAEGTYTVTLTVRDNDNRRAESIPHQVKVTAAPSGGGSPKGKEEPPSETTKTTTTTTTTSSTTTSTKTSTASKGKSSSKPQTQSQKLAAALKKCKKAKSKKQRQACEKQAKKKYSPKKKSTTKKKKAKKTKKK